MSPFPTRITTTSIAVILSFSTLWLNTSCGGSGSSSLPADARPDCVFAPTDFAALFATGTVTRDGIVNPANGFNFGSAVDLNCRFYQWAEQMFLWVTSPAPAVYGGGDRVFASKVFFDVTPPDAVNNRSLVPHTPGAIFSLGLRDVQFGAHGLKIITAKGGSLWEVVRPAIAASGRQQILDARGDTVEIAKATMTDKHLLLMYDPVGKLIQEPRIIIPVALKGQKVVQPIVAAGPAVFVNGAGSVIDVEQGEADNAVLMTQNGSLVYYSIMVNDVYAYYLTGLKDNAIIQVPVNFPTTFGDLQQITSFARANGVPILPDSVALAVELKASWVESSTLSDPQNYIRMDGMIPTYDKTNPGNWVVTGSRRTSLALVGIHIVGSINNHPEMIWATFEHNENTPDSSYSYFNTAGTRVNMPANTSGNWLVCVSGATGPFNQQHMQIPSREFLPPPPPNISPISPYSISPSNTIRMKPFGNAADNYPNQEDPPPGNPAYSNTRIISINNSVHNQLASHDVRGNYNFIGATWTFDGSPGNEANGAGTTRLCNSTMETYQQGGNILFATGGTCFSCHSGVGTASSHIFDQTSALF
jgi:hypothetical protein